MFNFYKKLAGLCLLATLLGLPASANISDSPSIYRNTDDEDAWLGLGTSSESGSGDGDNLDFETNDDKINGANDEHKKIGISAIFAKYNESCIIRPCYRSHNLVCSKKYLSVTGRCKCASGFIYVEEAGSCWSIPKSSSDTCSHDAQCRAGTWGEYSDCSKNSSTCECLDYETKENPGVIFVEGVCIIKKYIGDSCHTSEECNKTIQGEAYCHIPSHSVHSKVSNDLSGTCQCRNTHFWYHPLDKCMKKSTKLNDSCVITSQCREGVLGKYSICNNQTARCECYGGRNNAGKAFYHPKFKRCFPKKGYKDPCEDAEECKASLGPNAKCGRVDGHPHKIVCYDDSGSNTALIASVVVLCILLTIGIIFAGFFFLRRSHRIRFPTKKREVATKSSTSAGESLLPAQPYWTACSSLSIKIYPAEKVTSLTEIGQGYFANVFKGKLNGDIIAVKKVRDENATAVTREIETMANFSHPNILPLLGVAKVSDTEAPWLLFEFMEHGDLATVLRNEKFKSSSLTLTNDSDIIDRTEYTKPRFRLTDDKLLNISKQIAAGMKYLSFHRFVHRDLAARNCLVGATGAIKISDFGLSRDVYSGDYYRARGNKYLPIRWMSPESIMYGRFTVESDIWAYGIVLWEIFSWGKQPHFGYSNDEVIKRITDGVLLSPPNDSPEIIQELMSSCWKSEPSERLSFQGICEKFATLRSSIEDEMTESGYEIPKKANRPEYFQMEL